MCVEVAILLLGIPKFLREKPMLLNPPNKIVIQVIASDATSLVIMHISPLPKTSMLGAKEEDDESAEDTAHIPEEDLSHEYNEEILADEPPPSLHVMRCVLATFEVEDDRRCSTIFHTFTKCGERTARLLSMKEVV